MGTRRKFIRDCSALAAAAVLLPTPMLAVSQRGREVSLDDLDFETFAAQVNSRFMLHNGKGAAQALELIHAELIESNDRFAGIGSGGQFSLFFRGDTAQPLQQGTYGFKHARIGRFEMFIVPVGRQARNHRHYEAVFNRQLPPSLTHEHFDARSRPPTRQASHG